MDSLAQALGIDLEDPTTQAFLTMHRERQDLMDNLVQIRESRGLRQKDVAEKLGISRVAVSRMEGDPRLSTLIRYAEAVGAVVNLEATRVEESPIYRETYMRKMLEERNLNVHVGGWGRPSASAVDMESVQKSRDFVLAA